MYRPLNRSKFIRPAVVNPCLSVSQVRLAVPKLRSHIVQSFDGSNDTNKLSSLVNGVGDSSASTLGQISGDMVFEARNAAYAPTRAQDRDPSRLVVSRRGQTLWQDFLPKPVLLITGNHNFWAAACEDGSIFVWTPAGRRLTSSLRFCAATFWRFGAY